jgi:hypothetical protein
VVHETVFCFQVWDSCHIGISYYAPGKVLVLLQYFCWSVQSKVTTSWEISTLDTKTSKGPDVIYSKLQCHYVVMVQEITRYVKLNTFINFMTGLNDVKHHRQKYVAIYFYQRVNSLLWNVKLTKNTRIMCNWVTEITRTYKTEKSKAFRYTLW